MRSTPARGPEHLQRLGQGRLGQAIGEIPFGAYLAVRTKDRADGLSGFTGTPLLPNSDHAQGLHTDDERR